MTSNRTMGDTAPGDVAGALRRIYQTGFFEDGALPPFDETNERARIQPILTSLQTGGLTAESELGAGGSWMTNKLYIGLAGVPSWSEFYLDFDSTERRRELETRRDGLFYLIVTLSRVAPYRVAEWNQVVSQHGQVLPRVAPAPGTNEWKAAIPFVDNMLDRAGYQMLDARSTNISLDWLSSRYGMHSTLTVGQALFFGIE
jgi:hypothetical protein